MYPRVREVLKACERGGLEGVKTYFSQEHMNIDPSTWCGQIKKSIDEGYTISVLAEIQLLIEKFNFYEDVSEKTNRTGTKRVDGKGNNKIKG